MPAWWSAAQWHGTSAAGSLTSHETGPTAPPPELAEPAVPDEAPEIGPGVVPLPDVAAPASSEHPGTGIAQAAARSTRRRFRDTTRGR